MASDNYNGSVMMICSTCAGKGFEYANDEGPLRCHSCDRVFTRDELIKENGEIIDAEVSEIKAELLNDLKKKLKNSKSKKLQ